MTVEGFQRLKNGSVKEWATVSGQIGAQYPKTIAMRCPHCRHYAHFSLREFQGHQKTRIGSGFSICPGCNKRVVFIVHNFGKSDHEVSLYSAPPATDLELYSSLEGQVPKRISKAFEEAISSLASGSSNSAATSAGRALEGIMKDKLGDDADKMKMWEMIEAASEEIDFPAPMRELGNAVREGRNQGAHFDTEVDVNAETASKMVELVGLVARYVYVLPIEIIDSIKRLDEMKQAGLEK